MNAIASDVSAVPLAHRSTLMARVVELARRVAASDANLLVVGESGTGKGLLARFIHDASPRREGPFVTITCANIAADLLESELFGHEKGAFTGAGEQKKGRFELADGGTILIDGVSELQPSLQGKLLRVVQERSFERLAGTRTISVDVRILASTHADLEALVAAGSFRKDLFYRLNVIRIEIPALRDRMEDVPVLAEQALLDIAHRQGVAARRLSKGALDRLMSHAWPGNVRELQNVIESASILEDGPEIRAEAIRVGGVRPTAPIAEAVQRRYSLAQLEEAYIREVLRSTGNNRSEAARILGINRKTLLEKRKRYGIP
ncbi:MAG TPA: sigma-54 dependent transcriptional regulator [Candidatus Polarisedimenticolia bacterium]|nr:sigma-54 dependent transcriptional regulator [Candidatus Polarisedimenticolia bacterium]